MVVIAGDVPSYYYGKHPHQEVNLHADASQWEIYRPFVKRAWRVDTSELLPEILEKAFALAESGQPGPVLVNVPMDFFSAQIEVARWDRLQVNARVLVPPALDEATARSIVAHLLDAKNPVIDVGGGVALAPRLGRIVRAGRSPSPAAGARPDGQGGLARRSSVGAGHDRLLGHQLYQRHHPRR